MDGGSVHVDGGSVHVDGGSVHLGGDTRHAQGTGNRGQRIGHLLFTDEAQMQTRPRLPVLGSASAFVWCVQPGSMFPDFFPDTRRRVPVSA